jgi:tagatose 1,6-diphosphate aldolase GatY/KbaY
VALTSLQPLVEDAQRNGYAIPALNFINAESAEVILDMASALRAPALLLISPFECELVGMKTLVRIVSLLAEQTDVPVCLHLDHSKEIEPVYAAIAAGFSSVMVDGSSHEFEENVRLTKLAATHAHERGVSIEGELGAVGRVDAQTEEGQSGSTLTDPARAAEFVERSGVDFLAVSIGNAHGLYAQQPVLDFDRLAALRDATGVPLVLHGGSGTPPDQLRRAVELGICKVNVASELCRAWQAAVQAAWARENGTIWWSRAFEEGKAALRPIVRRWMEELGSAGRAPGRQN